MSRCGRGIFATFNHSDLSWWFSGTRKLLTHSLSPSKLDFCVLSISGKYGNVFPKWHISKYLITLQLRYKKIVKSHKPEREGKQRNNLFFYFLLLCRNLREHFNKTTRNFLCITSIDSCEKLKYEENEKVNIQTLNIYRSC